jgi:hypothetical protein
VPPDRIILFGTSLGTGVAMDLASKLVADKILPRGIVLQAPFKSVLSLSRDLGVPSFLTYLVSDRFDNLRIMPQLLHVPTYILHGTADELIPPAHAQALIEACRSPLQKLRLIPGATHAGYPLTWVGDVAAFFRTTVPAALSEPPPAMPPLETLQTLIGVPAPSEEELAERLAIQQQKGDANLKSAQWLQGVLTGSANLWRRIGNMFSSRSPPGGSESRE